MNPPSSRRSIPRWVKRWTFRVLIAFAIALPLRAAVIAPYRVMGNSTAPELRSGSWVLAYKLASDFQPGDLLIYRDGDSEFTARCEVATPETLKVSRNNVGLEIPRPRVVGRIVAATH
jgi:signal peptidase I